MSHILTYFAFCLFRILRHIMNYRLFLFPSEISLGGDTMFSYIIDQLFTPIIVGCILVLFKHWLNQRKVDKDDDP